MKLTTFLFWSGFLIGAFSMLLGMLTTLQKLFVIGVCNKEISIRLQVSEQGDIR